MNKIPLIIAVLVTTLFTTGCGNRFWKDTKGAAGDTYDYVFDTAPTARSYHAEEQIPLIEINHQAADVLYSNVRGKELSDKSPVYVQDFTNQNNPADKSIFGHVMTEQVVDRLVQRGMLITAGDPKPNAFFLPKGMSKDKYNNPPKGTIETLPPRSAMLSGKYVIGDNYIYMTSKITRLDDKAIISGHNWTIPISDNVRQMLPQLQLEDGLEPSVKTTF